MGQEWAASTPFCYFTDHHKELGRLVTVGRRKEFSRFKGFSDVQSQLSIPDPQDASTYERSKLSWEELDQANHQDVLSLYRDLLHLRKMIVTSKHTVKAVEEHTITIRYDRHFVIVCFARSRWPVEINVKDPDWQILWKTGDAAASQQKIQFNGPGAIILQYQVDD